MHERKHQLQCSPNSFWLKVEKSIATRHVFLIFENDAFGFFENNAANFQQQMVTVIYLISVENEAFKEIKDEIPVTESLKDLIERTMPYWKSTIVPCILSGENILIVAHGTSLRGLVKEIEDLTDEEVNKLNLPTAIPFVYQLDRETLRPLKARQYLADEEIVKKAVEKVASIANKKA